MSSLNLISAEFSMALVGILLQESFKIFFLIMAPLLIIIYTIGVMIESLQTGFLLSIQAIDKSGICFLHAPLFHPAMKNVAPIRKELGMKTFFNMLGPLVNPSMPKKQIVGVFNLELARIYNYLLQKTDKKYSIIYSLDGYDEISLTNDTKIYSNNSEKNYSSKEFGLENIKPDEIKGGVDIPSSSKIFMNVLNGNGTESQNNVVCANAGVAISISKGISISEGFEAAKESLKSSKALSSFNKLKEIMK